MNNYYGKPEPLPRIQGFGWDWPFYWLWYDDKTPIDDMETQKNYIYTNRESDINWTLNQVRFDAAYGEKPGVINIQMGTFTPNFRTYLINRDGQGWIKANRKFEWNLQSGINKLEMRVENKAGIKGPVSFIELKY